jgi:hypothetical protein
MPGCGIVLRVLVPDGKSFEILCIRVEGAGRFYLDWVFTQMTARIQKKRAIVFDVGTEVTDRDEVRSVELESGVLAKDRG